MKQRVLEILFKHKVLILLPLVIIVTSTALMAAQPVPVKWTSTSSVWVDEFRPLYQDARLGWSPGPAQAGLLSDFLRTRTFARDVIAQTRLAPMLDDPLSEALAMRELANTVAVYPNSNTMLTISATSTDRELTVEFVNAVMNRFQQALQERSAEQSQAAINLYRESLTTAEATLVKARQDLADYTAANPQIFQRTVDSSLPLSARDPNLAQLSSQVTNAEGAYLGALRRVQELQEMSVAGDQGRPFGFTVLDQPELPAEPIRARLATRLKLPVIGLVMGALISSAVAVVMVLTNRTVIGAFDVARQFDLPVVGQLPPLKRRRWIWQHRPGHAVRLVLATPARPRVPGI